MIVCAGKSEQIRGALPIGVGLIESAINLAELIRKNSPKNIIFIGSAGSYGRFKIFDEVTSCCASQVEISFLRDKTYTPLQDFKICNVSCETNTIVNSSNFITCNKEDAKIFFKNGYDLENMEFYSVLYMAKKYKINAKGIFVVTNYCNKDAHNDFINNHKEATKMMEKIVEDLGLRI